MAQAAAALTVAAAALVLPAGTAGAHPLGNFSVNVFSGLRVGADRIRVDLVVDMAEIPTYQARRAIDTNGDGTIGAAESSAYAGRACGDAARAVDVTVSGRRATVRTEAADVVFPDGAAGLPTLRLTCDLVAALGADPGERDVVFRNRHYDDRVGWREVVATGDGAELVTSSVPATSLSQRLTQYPEDLLQSPLDQRSATLRFRPGGATAPEAGGPSPPAATAAPRSVDRFSQAFTRLVARQDLTVPFGLLALGLAVVLGAVHAVAPGHGKTVMAAYLVGQRGDYRQAWVIGATMTATHTAGVLVLGVVISTSTTLAPETLYPWLGLVSGLVLAAIGAGLLYRAVRWKPGPGHHAHGHGHTHDHDHETPERRAAQLGRDAAGASVGWRGLVGMGLVGGLLPSPSALVVLLGAIALRRAWFGVALVVAYGIGMAATLLATGLLLVRAREGIAARLATSSPRRLNLLVRVVPATTAAAVLAAGVFFTVQGTVRI